MKNKKLIIAVAVLLAVVCAMAAVFFLTRPNTEEGSKEITVTVVHADGSTKEFKYRTDAEYVGAVLQEKGLVEGTMGEFGLYIEKVDGEVASWENGGAYWAFYVGEEYATLSADQTPAEDGKTYKLVYTVG